MTSKQIYPVGDKVVGRMGDYYTAVYDSAAEVEAELDREELKQLLKSLEAEVKTVDEFPWRSRLFFNEFQVVDSSEELIADFYVDGESSELVTKLYNSIPLLVRAEELLHSNSKEIQMKTLRDAAHSGWFGTSAQSTLLRMAELIEKEGEYPVSGRADNL